MKLARPERSAVQDGKPYKQPAVRLRIVPLRAAIVLGSAGLIAAIGGLLWYALQTDPRQAGALKTSGAIVGVTYDAQPLVLGTNWQKWVLRVLPDLQPRVGGKVLRHGIPRAGPMVVWVCDGPTGVDSLPTLPMRLTADTGARMETVATGELGGHRIGGHSIGPFALKTYPRRGRTVRIQPVSYRPSAEPTEPRVVLNPTPGPYPTWAPEPLPSARRTGPLEVTLTRLRTVPLAPGVQPWWARTELEVQMREGRKPAARAWSVESVSVSDATGNVWDFISSWLDPFAEVVLDSSPIAPGRQRLQLRPLGLPDESAYRLRLELARSDRFPPEDVWPLQDVPIAAAGKVSLLGWKRMLHGCSVEAAAVIGEDADAGMRCSGGPTLVVRLGPGSERYFLRVRAEERGRRVTWEPVSVHDGVACVPLGSEGRERRTSLTLALTPRRTVEFLARADGE
jgi:hypothetical protein